MSYRGPRALKVQYTFKKTWMDSPPNAGLYCDSKFTRLATAVQFDAGLAPITGPVLHSVRHPILSTVPAVITQGLAFTATSSGSSANTAGVVTSTGFMPRLENSFGQSASSAGNSPVFQLQSIDSEQMRFVRNEPGIATTDQNFLADAGALLDFPPGPILVRIWVGGVPSASLTAALRSDRIFANGFPGN